MRYVRFLKTPRIISGRQSRMREVQCLITITSDLGDSFLPHDIELSAELLPCAAPENGPMVSHDIEPVPILPPNTQPDAALVWQTVHWKAGMRSLQVTFPLVKWHASGPLKVRVGVGPKASHDEYGKLSNDGAHGVVSAWSAEFHPSIKPTEAEKLIERRFMLPDGPTFCLWEETGESIARHLWDAGIALSCHMKAILDKRTALSEALLRSNSTSTGLRVLELGTGCGMVGISVARVLKGATVMLTDLPEAREIVERNIRNVITATGSSLQFRVLDWDGELPVDLQSRSAGFDLVLAADCTYNPDSSPALVNTLTRVAKISPEVTVAIAMKMRHSSEEIFFDLIAAAGFRETKTITYPLPGDIQIGEEIVYLHVYRLGTERD